MLLHIQVYSNWQTKYKEVNILLLNYTISPISIEVFQIWYIFLWNGMYLKKVRCQSVLKTYAQKSSMLKKKWIGWNYFSVFSFVFFSCSY